jgi:hypothetical protein
MRGVILAACRGFYGLGPRHGGPTNECFRLGAVSQNLKAAGSGD